MSETPLWSRARARADLPGLLSLLAFLALTAALFRSREFALLVTASLGFHEMGHALALAWYRLDFRIHFGLVGAYTWSRQAEREQLSQWGNTIVHLAGPFFSLLLAFAALALHNLWLSEFHHLLVLANFSAQIGFLNLLPLGSLTDGGKALSRLAGAAAKRRERAVVAALAWAALLGPLLGLAWPLWQQGARALPNLAVGLLLVGVWLAASWLLELVRGRQSGGLARPASSNEPLASLCEPPALVGRQMVLAAVFLWDLLAALLLVILATPFWLEPRYLLGTVQNADVLLQHLETLLSLAIVWLVN